MISRVKFKGIVVIIVLSIPLLTRIVLTYFVPLFRRDLSPVHIDTHVYVSTYVHV